MKQSFMRFFVIFVLCLISVLAFASADFDTFVKIIPIDDDISLYEEATFNISLVNLKDFTDTISIYSPNIDSWSIKLNPDSVLVAPGGSEYVLLRAKPKENIIPGREYGIQLNIRAKKSTQLQKAYAFVNVKSQNQVNREYLPVISVETSELGELDPTESVVFTIDLENKNVKDIKGLKVMLNSDVFDDKAVTDLGPLQKKSVQFTLTMPSSTQPMEDNLIITLGFENTTVLSRSVDYSVISIEQHDYEVERSSAFLIVKHNVMINNEGNLITEGEYKVPTNLFNYFLIRGDADSKLKVIDKRLYKQFQVTLQPGESYNLNVIVSYRPIVYALLFLIIVISLYYLVRSPLVIRKSISSIKTKEGSLSELKVLLHIKNRTRKVYEDILVLDRIPKITEIGKEFDIGTIKPTKIMSHEKKGTIAKWELASLDSYEERVIAYKLFSNLNILGGLTLPVGLLKFRTARGREKMISSNKIKLVIQKFKGDRREK